MKCKNEWTKVIFSDVIQINPRESLAKGTLCKKVNMADIIENTKNIGSFSFEEYKGGSKFRQDDTLFARITPCLENGKIAKVNILDDNEIGFGSTEFIVIRAKPGITDSEYVYYLTLWDEVRDTAIKSMTGTSGRQRVQNAVFHQLYINLPSLDEKIENNNAIISNLEDQAQAIFKSWFIDFEPFQEGEFVDSELGEIPEGWGVEKLGKLFEFCKGKKPKNVFNEEKKDYVPYLVKKYIDGSEVSFANKEDGILINEMNIFMLMDGANSGNIYYGYKGIIGSTFSVLKVENNYEEEYLYWYLRIKESEIKNQNTGSAIPHANKNYIQNIEVAIPIDKELIDTLLVLRDIRKYVINLNKQNQTLAQLRDTLLPKLMSGELRLGQDDIGDIVSQL